MRTLTNHNMAVITAGSSSCEATVTGIFAFGSAFVMTPGIGIVGGTAMVVSAGLWAFGGCGNN